MMDATERKIAFRTQATRDRRTLHAAAYEVCGVTWFHLSDGIQGKRPLSAGVQQRFADYIGRTVEDVFGDAAKITAA